MMITETPVKPGKLPKRRMPSRIAAVFACFALAGCGSAVPRVHEVQSIQAERSGRIREIRNMNEMQDGVLLVTADWCKACHIMEPVMNTASELLRGKVIFAKIDIDNTDLGGRLPIIRILKNGRIIDQAESSMELPFFIEWLGRNGVDTRNLSLTGLFLQGKNDVIVELAGWHDMKRELGRKKTMDVFRSVIFDEDPHARNKGLVILYEAAVSADKADSDLAFTEMNKLLSDSGVNAQITLVLNKVAETVDLLEHPQTVRKIKQIFERADSFTSLGASLVLGRMATRTPIMILPYLVEQLRSEGDVRYFAANALQSAAQDIDLSKEPQVIDALSVLLEDEDIHIRGKAACALLEIAKRNPSAAGNAYLRIADEYMHILDYDITKHWLKTTKQGTAQHEQLMEKARRLERSMKKKNIRYEPPRRLFPDEP